MPLHQAKVYLDNVTLELELAAVGEGPHWQIEAANFVNVDNVRIVTNSTEWNAAIALSHWVILGMVNTYVGDVFEDLCIAIEDFNQLTGFYVDVFDPRYPWNLTATGAPQADMQGNLLTLNIDGTFYDQPLGTNHVGENSRDPKRLVGLGNNQAFVHQKLAASLFFALEQEILPARVNDTSLLQLFPEIKLHYGPSIQEQIYIDLSVADGDFLTFSNVSGVEVGKKSPVTAHLQVFCKNAQMSVFELAVQFDMNLDLTVNTYVDSQWQLHLNLPQAEISGVQISHDRIGMFDRDYDYLLSAVLESAVNDLNV